MSAPLGTLGIASHFINDILPWLNCCKHTIYPEMYCPLYYERRPSDSGADYVPPRPANGAGDPLITTFDNFPYTFNGVGEFWAVKTTPSNPLLYPYTFQMQARIEKLAIEDEPSSHASIFTAFAFSQLKQGNRIALVQIQRNQSSGCLALKLDEEHIPFNNDNTEEINLPFSGGSLSYSSQSEPISLSFVSGFSFQIFPGPSNSLTFTASARQDLLNSTQVSVS